MLDREPQQTLARMTGHRESEAGVLVDPRLDVAPRLAPGADDLERRDQARPSMADTPPPVSLQPLREAIPRLLVVERARRAVAVRDRVERDDRRDPRILGG